MSVILTCGHKAKGDEDGISISTKAYTREKNKAVDYKTVCINCFQVYENEDLILLNEEECIKWLNKK